MKTLLDALIWKILTTMLFLVGCGNTYITETQPVVAVDGGDIADATPVALQGDMTQAVGQSSPDLAQAPVADLAQPQADMTPVQPADMAPVCAEIPVCVTGVTGVTQPRCCNNADCNNNMCANTTGGRCNDDPNAGPIIKCFTNTYQPGVCGWDSIHLNRRCL